MAKIEPLASGSRAGNDEGTENTCTNSLTTTINTNNTTTNNNNNNPTNHNNPLDDISDISDISRGCRLYSFDEDEDQLLRKKKAQDTSSLCQCCFGFEIILSLLYEDMLCEGQTREG